MNKLYRFSLDYGRMGSLDGLFTADSADVERLLGQEVYLGEALGKHSEVSFTYEEGILEVVCEDQDFLAKMKEYGMSGGISGYNIIDRLLEQEEWDE